MIHSLRTSLSWSHRKRYPDVQWKDMARLRDLAVHHYWKIDALKVWEIAKEDVPFLLTRLSKR